MKTLTEHLTQYAGYHRYHRNLWTHVVGIPLILLSLEIGLAQWVVWAGAVGTFGDVALSAAALVSALAATYYLRLDLRLGSVMALWLALACLAGQAIAALPLPWWLSAIALFLVGWAFQFLGHHYEGRKPAFLDDLVGLLIGPLFVAAELGFMLGLRQEVQASIVDRAGPLR